MLIRARKRKRKLHRYEGEREREKLESVREGDREKEMGR